MRIVKNFIGGDYSILGFIVFFTFIIQTSGFSQPPVSQTVGGITQQEEDIKEKRALEKEIERDKPVLEEISAEELIPADEGSKVFVRKIVVEEVMLLSSEEIENIISVFEGKELSLKTMRKVADLITDEYRKKGYATSRAYLPPQTIADGVLLIRVVEGKLGELEIKGNKYFKTSLIRKKLDVVSEGYFDYSALQQSLVYINEHPDRVAKAILVPGKEPGTTDLVIEVEDRLPIHVGFEYDNYGSRYINEDRYALTLEHNNLSGNDDKAYFKLQYSDGTNLKLRQGRYSYPLTSTVDLGVYFLNSTVKLGEEFKALDSRGKAEIYGLFANKALITEDDLDFRLNFGFDYKSVKNYILGVQSSRDEVRIFKLGCDLDVNDDWGRTIFMPVLDVGVPDIFGGMDSKDENSSRAGAGGKFYKGSFNLFRLQSMPGSSSLLWKNSGQYTNYNLVASEEFQIGGPISVRGYPAAEYSGSRGYYTSLEWSFPCWLIMDEYYRVPFTEESLYDAFRWVVFYDWATVHRDTVAAGEEKHSTLRGIGFGARMNVRDYLSLRVEVGYPLGETPSDGDHAHPWVELVWKF